MIRNVLRRAYKALHISALLGEGKTQDIRARSEEFIDKALEGIDE